MLKEKRVLENTLNSFDKINNGLTDNIDLAIMAEEENDESILDQVETELTQLAKIASKFETECLFSGELDLNNCFLEINAGAGGTESHDWASIMMRMYLRFAERLGFKTEIIK